MPNENTVPKFSENIRGTCRMIDEALKDYEWNTNELKRMDGLQQDYLHHLELDELDDGGIIALAYKLRECRKQRRAHKDTIEILQPLVDYFHSESGKRLLNLLREVSGKTKYVENRMANRVYVNRVLEGVISSGV